MKTKVIAMAHGPYAIAKEDGVIFIENACPGDELELEIYDQRKDFAYAHIIELLEASELRAPEPPCKIHKICGSCQWQHIQYDEQLKFKQQNLTDLIPGVETPAIVGMDEPWNFRNKITYPVEVVGKTGRVKAGYFKRNSNELINVKHCPIQYSIFDEIMDALKEQMSTRGYPDKLIRHIMLRSNIDQSEILLCVVLRESMLDKEFRNKLRVDLNKIQEKFPQIVTTSINYNDLSTNVILGQKTEVHNGPGYITETFGGIKLEISTTSFFQVNTKQFLKIVEQIKSAILRTLSEEKGTSGSHKLLDLYCGIGTISLSLAKAIPELDITGIELVESAVENAKKNAEINQISTAKFIHGKVEDLASPEPSAQSPQPYDIVIVNPPRKGCTNKVLNDLGQLKFKQLIYVSCNPSTLARDAKHLEQFGFKIQSLQGFDMFPHSFHFETLAVLTRE
ncbi:MAG: 23S rRNA (uracil(1939)-C(5))-methyltransferase RlmD [Candidatus Melainabacteria bacterium]|nr:23S rRNA (uracil(1939)-C(5))-methyltransferase RlmD [Candidatus Melainabacteria bacterium]